LHKYTFACHDENENRREPVDDHSYDTSEFDETSPPRFDCKILKYGLEISRRFREGL
jgi:hypothetical protein